MNEKVELLKNNLASADSAKLRVDILNELSWELILTDEEQSFAYCEEANDLLTTQLQNYRKGRVDHDVVLSYHYRQQARYDDALQLLGDAENYYTGQQDKHGLLRCYYIFSIIYLQLDNRKLRLEYVLKRLEIAEELNLDNVVATVQFQLGTHYMRQEEIDKSLDYYYRSLDYYLKHKRQKNAGIVLTNISCSYRIAKQFDKALDYVEQALSLLKQIDNIYDLAIALGVQGLTYEELGQYDKSLASHRAKLTLVEQQDSDFMRGYTYADIGRVMVKTGQIDEGIPWILSAIEISEKNAVQLSLSQAYEAIVEAYEAKGDYQSAFEYQKKLMEVKEDTYKSKLEAERTALIVIHETQQAQLEARLQSKRAEHFRTLAEKSPDLILRIAHDGTFRYANAAVEDAFGIAIDDIIGKKFDNLSITSEFQMLMNDVLKNAPELRSTEQRVLHYQTEDNYHTYDVLVVPEFDNRQSISHLLLIARDITVLKETEDRLRAGEQRYRALFEQSNDGILILSLIDENDVVRIIDANQKFCDMLGYTHEEIRGMKTTDLVVPEERQESVATSRKILEKQDVAVHTRRAMTKDGRLITVEITGRMIVDDSETPLYAQSIVRDVTEREKMGEALRQSEARFRAFTEKSSDLIITLDSDGKITYVSPQTKTITPFAQDEIVGMDLSQIPNDFLEAETRQYIRQKFEEALQATLNESVDFELPLHDADGQLIWLRGTATNLLEDPDVSALVVNVHNVTELQQALSQEQEESTFVKILLQLSTIQQQNQSQQVLIERILDSLDTIFPNGSTHVMLVENDVATVVAVSGNARLYGDDLVGHTMNIRDFTTLKTMRTTKYPLLISDTRRSTIWKPRSISEDVFCYMGTPIIVAGEVIGFINLHSTVADQFTEDMLLRLYTIANYVGIVIHNMNALEQERDVAIHDERQRIARELHDAVSQYLFSSKLIAESLPNLLKSDNLVSVESGANLLVDLTSTALIEMRMLLLELRPERLIQIPLPSLIESLVESFKIRLDTVEFQIMIDFESSDVAFDIKLNLYRLIQEALNNIAKHANPQTITLLIRGNQHNIEIIIEDDGIGFDMGEVRPDSMGLKIMRERAQQSGITLIMSSTKGEGSRIELHYSDMIQEEGSS